VNESSDLIIATQFQHSNEYFHHYKQSKPWCKHNVSKRFVDYNGRFGENSVTDKLKMFDWQLQRL